MLEVTPHGKHKRTRRSSQAFAALPSLGTAQHTVLGAWMKSPAQERNWQSLLEAAGREHLETANALLEVLLNVGAVAVKEELVHTQWRPWRVAWTDLEALQRAAGLTTHTERQADKSRAEAQLKALADEHPWLASAVQSCVHSKLSAPVRAARAELLVALAQWKQEERQGLRQDFALAARGHTKALTVTEWDWLGQHVALEALGIARFEPLLFLGGALALQNMQTDAQWDFAIAGFGALPCRQLCAPLGVRKAPVQYWLIENRASFERQAQQLEEGVCIVWLPGRPGHDWQAAMRWLLQVAPAPALLSCDPDPAGIQIALTAGALWDQVGLAWQAVHMEPQRWLDGPTLPLTPYDQRTLQALAATPLPIELATLRDALLHHQCKAEQEGWL